MGLNQVDDELKEKVKLKMLNIYDKNEYNDQYSPLEWAFRIGLPLTEERYKQGKEIHLQRESIFDIWLANKSANQDTIDKIEKLKEKFIKWLEKYDNKYEVK